MDGFEKGLLLFIGLIAFAIVGVLGWAVYSSLTAETYDLPKDEWACVASHKETSVIYVTVGKVSVPQPVTSTVCDAYERR